MSRLAKTYLGVFLFFCCMCLHAVTFAQQQSDADSAFRNLKQSLNDRTKASKEGGRLDDFPKTIIDGNIYEHAHKMVEYQIAYPSASALELTYEAISERCRGNYQLRSEHVTNVFANTVPGERLYDLLEARNAIDDIQEYNFELSCVEVVKCHLRDQLKARDIDPATWNAYTHTTFNTCMSIVQDIYSTMIQRTSGIMSMRNNNFGDDIFMNADPKDSPYDLLTDIEHIADIMFVHNDEASEIHYYNMYPTNDYVDNDPDDLTYYDTIEPENQDRMDRLPPSRGVPADEGQVTGVYPPAENIVGDDANDQGPDDMNEPGIGDTTTGPLVNIICEEPVPFDDQSESDTELGEEQQEQTITYNDKLSLDDKVAILLGSKMTESDEELLGDDDAGNDPERAEAEQEAQAIVDEVVDLKGDTLDQVKNHVQGCIEQFTENDPGARRRVLRKSITQPTEFTKCVFAGLCKEIGDPSGRGLYRIKICKEPRKGVGVVSHKKVKSVEGVMDELLSACYGLKESGQLLEHNKTKDHMEHKVMRVKLGDKVSFGLSIIFKPIQDRLDPASVKRMMIENNKYLESMILSVSDDLTFVDERNKYLLLHNSEQSKSLLENGGARQAFEKADTYLLRQDRSEIASQREKRSQMIHYGETLDDISEFVQLNIEFRRYANETMDSMKDVWEWKKDEFQASPGY